MKRLLAVFWFFLLLAAAPVALGETSVTVAPESPRAGDYVEVTVSPDRENPDSVSYALFYGPDLEKVFSGKGIQRYSAWCRLRKEGIYTLQVTVACGKEKETASVEIHVSGEAPSQEGTDVIYSQKDGWWKKKKYASSELQTSGCAIFTMSHALQRMGYTGLEVTPEELAKHYVFYRSGEGTWNEGLVNKLGEEYDFLSQKELLTSTKEITAALRRGDCFSFSIADRHIALADGISEDGTKVHIVDSAPGATFERIRNKEAIFYLSEDGTFTQASAPDDLPGIRWFFETQEYGGMEYWMDIEYCALRGMRLIRKPWLKADLGEGLKGVGVEYAGALITKVTRDGKTVRVPTRDLVLTGKDGALPQVALVTAKNGTFLLDGNGKRLKNRSNANYRIRRMEMVLMLDSGEDSVYVCWDNVYGYLNAKDITVLTASAENFRTGIITQNGNTSGGSQVTVHLNPDRKSTGLFLWKTGTPVAVVEKQDSYYLVEAKGCRGWIHEKYILLDGQEGSENNTEGSQENGQEIDKGE